VLLRILSTIVLEICCTHLMKGHSKQTHYLRVYFLVPEPTAEGGIQWYLSQVKGPAADTHTSNGKHCASSTSNGKHCINMSMSNGKHCLYTHTTNSKHCLYVYVYW